MENHVAVTVADQNDTVNAVLELPAPPGWMKKFTPRKTGTPKRHDVVFISPTGEEIKNKSQLNKYLKSHPGDLSTSDFDWGTGTPRRSARLGEISKGVDTSGSDPPKKRQKKLDLQGEFKEESAEVEAEDKQDATKEETKGSAESEEIVAKEIQPEADIVKDEEKKTDEREIVIEEPPASEDKMEIEQENKEKVEDAKDEPLFNQDENNQLPSTGLEEIQAESKPTEVNPLSHEENANKANPSQIENSNDAAKVEEENKLNKEIPVESINGTEAAIEQNDDTNPANQVTSS